MFCHRAGSNRHITRLTSGNIHIYAFSLVHVKWVPLHHDMARPQVSDGGDGLQKWSVAANILNKQSRTAEEGGPPTRGLGVGLTIPHLRKIILIRDVT
jgi:hypothetical protein